MIDVTKRIRGGENVWMNLRVSRRPSSWDDDDDDDDARAHNSRSITFSLFPPSASAAAAGTGDLNRRNRS